MSAHHSNPYESDPPDPILKLELAKQDGVCDYCGYEIKAGEVVDVSGARGLGTEVMMMCQACIESECPGAVASFLDPEAANVYDDGADDAEPEDEEAY
jgi:hypothetical protein